MESARLLAADTRGDSAVTSDTMKVDWAQPLEAVSPKGEVVEVRFAVRQSDGDWDRQPNKIEPSLPGGISWFGDDGSHPTRTWTIRNKPAAAVAPVGGGEQWGPAIEVGGVRPEWLGNRDNFQWTDRNHHDFKWWGTNCTSGGCFNPEAWDQVLTIRLPANHPHYRTEKTAEASLGVLTGVERLERYEGFLRRLAGGLVGNAEAVAEAKALLPVDPDLLKAREICAVIAEGMSDDGLATEYRRGDLDEQFEMRSAIAGLRSLASDHRSK